MTRYYSGDLTVRVEWYGTNARGRDLYRGSITGPTNAGRTDAGNPRWSWEFSELSVGVHGIAADAARAAIAFGAHQESGDDAPDWLASPEIAGEIENGCSRDEFGEVRVARSWRCRW